MVLIHPAVSHQTPLPLGAPHVVLIDDNTADVRLMRLAIEEVGIKVQVEVATTAAGAFGLMRKLPNPPAVVLLDLNLPIIKGDEVLHRIRQSSRWSQVPVIILSSSQDQRDIERCFELGASAFKTKPSDFEDFLGFARSLLRYVSGDGVP